MEGFAGPDKAAGLDKADKPRKADKAHKAPEADKPLFNIIFHTVFYLYLNHSHMKAIYNFNKNYSISMIVVLKLYKYDI